MRGYAPHRQGRWLRIPVIVGRCGQLPVVLGSAPAMDLAAVSFADLFDESAQTGYQRRCDERHAEQFREYIEGPAATTIPLTFNLRGAAGSSWRLRPENAADGTHAELGLRIPAAPTERVVARVDCQHRLEKMADSPVPLAFQCFLGLTPLEEMRIFSVINSKAKGLNASLTDYHESRLKDVAREAADLHIATLLNDDPRSVWYKRVNLSGAATQGTNRRITLRGMRNAIFLFLQHGLIRDLPIEAQYRVVAAFWAAVASTWPAAWSDPRKHFLTKGIGVQGLSLLAGDIVKLAMREADALSQETFERYLARVQTLNWANTGPFRGLGGRSGAREVHERLARQIISPQPVALVR
jgi:DGQHR domain-containing protein